MRKSEQGNGAAFGADEPAGVGKGVGLASIVAGGREDIEVGDVDAAAIELDELQRAYSCSLWGLDNWDL